MIYNFIILNFMLEFKRRAFAYSMKAFDGSRGCSDMVGKEVIFGDVYQLKYRVFGNPTQNPQIQRAQEC